MSTIKTTNITHGSNSGTANLILDSSGNAKVGGGIYLGGTGSANFFNDYEEGTFTPILTGSTWSYSAQVGYYVKVGKLCYATIKITWTTAANSGNIGVDDLPFTSSSDANIKNCASFGYCSKINLGTNRRPPVGIVADGDDAISVFMLNDNAAPDTISNSDVGDDGEFQCSILYKTA
tara:strand:- start:44 stop:574 length:531 start_codon:yes stop_codon:yes gene_type:complete